MILGRKRNRAPSITASRRPCTVSPPIATRFRSTASSRSMTITTPVCTAVPHSAMKPTHTTTENKMLKNGAVPAPSQASPRGLEGIHGVIAMTRKGLPDPPTILSGAAMTIAPVGGS